MTRRSARLPPLARRPLSAGVAREVGLARGATPHHEYERQYPQKNFLHIALLPPWSLDNRCESPHTSAHPGSTRDVARSSRVTSRHEAQRHHSMMVEVSSTSLWRGSSIYAHARMVLYKSRPERSRQTPMLHGIAKVTKSRPPLPLRRAPRARWRSRWCCRRETGCPRGRSRASPSGVRSTTRAIPSWSPRRSREIPIARRRRRCSRPWCATRPDRHAVGAPACPKRYAFPAFDERHSDCYDDRRREFLS